MAIDRKEYNKEYWKIYAEKNRERLNSRKNSYYEANKEEISLRRREKRAVDLVLKSYKRLEVYGENYLYETVARLGFSDISVVDEWNIEATCPVCGNHSIKIRAKKTTESMTFRCVNKCKGADILNTLEKTGDDMFFEPVNGGGLNE